VFFTTASVPRRSIHSAVVAGRVIKRLHVAAGFSAFFSKPNAFEELVGVVESAARRGPVS